MPYPDWAAEVDRSGDGSVRHFMTEPHTPAAIQFAATVPRWAYATDSLKEGIWRQDRAIALSSRYIQTNASHLLRYLTFDIDWPGAYFAASDGILPPPNWIAEDRQNGRAHLGYELAAPVAKSDAARVGPLRYLAAVERGMTRRLEADPGYAGFVTKNPLSQHWRTTWLSVSTYPLAELADWLHRGDTRKCSRIGDATGLGRNCTLFEELRAVAYRSVLRFKRDGGPTAFAAHLMHAAAALNLQFEPPLPFSEIRATVRSVAKWTWRQFDEHQFSHIQALRGRHGGLRSGEVRLEQRDARAIVARDLQTRLTGYPDPPPEGGLSDKASCPKKCQPVSPDEIGSNRGP